MDSQSGQNASSLLGGCEFSRDPMRCEVVESADLVPSPRTLEVTIWEDATAQVLLFHTKAVDEGYIRVCYLKSCSRRDLLAIINHIEQFHGEDYE